MQVTAFGLIFLPLLLLVAIWGRPWLPGLVLGSAAFQAAAVANLSMGASTYGLSPYMAASAVAGGVLLVRWYRGHPPWPPPHLRTPALLLLAYGAVAVLGAFVLPRLFAGLPVQPLLGPNGYVLKVFPPLEWGLSHLAQAINLCMHLVVALFLWQTMGRADGAPRKALIGLAVALVVAATAGLHDRMALLWQWPRMASFWLSNLGYDLVDHVPVALNNPTFATAGGPRFFSFARVSSPFSEPSYGSAFFAATFAGFLAWALLARTRVWVAGALAFLSALALLNTVGSTGWVSGACALLGIALWALGRATGRAKQAQPSARPATRLAIASCALAAALALLWHSPAGKMLPGITQMFIVQKAVNLKADGRYRSDVRALALTRQTHGLGAGLGSNRSSSFLTSILSNTGVPGTLAFLGMVVTLLWRYARARQLTGPQYFAVTALATAMLGASLSIPDLNLPFLWAFVFLAFLHCPVPPPVPLANEGAT